MEHVNGLAVAAGPPGLQTPGGDRAGKQFSPERIRELLDGLSEPFDPDVVEWRVTNTAPGRHGRRGQVVAYADQRAYTDRLNDLFTPLGWTRDYGVQTVQNFELPTTRGGKDRMTVIAAKVLVTCRVTVYGLGTHSGTGEEWATDENALTRAEAQAFKRACSCFGLGRYFYDLPRTWVDLDEFNKPCELPTLPAWALPANRSCPPRQGPDAPGTVGTAANGTQTPNSRSRQNGLYGEELRGAVERLCEEVGFSLARFVVYNITGKDDAGRVHNNAHLTQIMEKLDDLARGVRRLKAAIEKAGPGAYRELCRELNLPSDAIDDIPNRDILRQVVRRMEAVAAACGDMTDRNADGNGDPTGQAKNGTGGIGIAQLRERLLIEARRASTSLRRGIGDVIGAASKGSFSFADLTKLTDADCVKVEAALEEIQRMAS